MRALKPHGKEWYERLATLQNGYFYPWRSRIERIFREYGVDGSVWLPHGRTLWRAVA